MVKDGEKLAEEGKAVKEKIDARNQFEDYIILSNEKLSRGQG
jgi:hypothetical protein